MKASLVSLLACPDCHASLRLETTESNGEEILAGAFECAACGKRFGITGGVPRFAPKDTYVSTFSFEWKRWRRTQFDTAARSTSASTFHASTGRRPEQLAGKIVLDAGCGAGRYMDLVARAGAEVVGVDLSLAIEVARENLRAFPNSHFLQADLLRLPFRPGVFDFVYSIGVLHHTSDTHAALSGLAQVTRDGGEVAIWVYPRQRLTEAFRYFPARVNEVLAEDVSFRIPAGYAGLVRRLAPALDWIMETSSSLERAVTTRLPVSWLYALCHAAIPLYYLYRIPIFYPFRLVSKIAMDPDPEWRVLDTFDWYSPKYHWNHTYPEVLSWFEEEGFENISFLPRPVAMRGAKMK
jgi:SAM-dependent methyltransferase